MKFRFSFGITLACGEYEPALKLCLMSEFGGCDFFRLLPIGSSS
jgi:hypothetical protein